MKIKKLIIEKEKILNVLKDTILLENKIFLLKKINKINNKILNLLENQNNKELFFKAFQEYNSEKENITIDDLIKDFEKTEEKTNEEEFSFEEENFLMKEDKTNEEENYEKKLALENIIKNLIKIQQLETMLENFNHFEEEQEEPTNNEEDLFEDNNEFSFEDNVEDFNFEEEPKEDTNNEEDLFEDNNEFSFEDNVEDFNFEEEPKEDTNEESTKKNNNITSIKKTNINNKVEKIYVKISNNNNYLLLNKTKKDYININKKYFEKECILNVLLDIFENYLDKNITYKIFYSKNFSDKRDKNFLFEKYIEDNFKNITLYKEENLKIESFKTYKPQYYEYTNISKVKNKFQDFNNNYINNLQNKKAIFIDASIKKGKYSFLGIHDNINNLKFSYKLPNNFIKDSNHLELFGYVYLAEKYKNSDNDIVIYGDNKHMIEKLQENYIFVNIEWIPRELNKKADNLANNSKITKKLDENICKEIKEITDSIINNR